MDEIKHLQGIVRLQTRLIYLLTTEFRDHLSQGLPANVSPSTNPEVDQTLTELNRKVMEIPGG